MIRNIVVHASSEQPLLADLYSIPTAADAGLLCTNVRMMDGKRPVFIDNISATFFFPYHVIRFLEIPPEELARHMAEGGAMPSFGSEDRVAGAPGDDRFPVPVGGADDGAGAVDLDDLEIDLDLDEDFLQRVRDA